MPPFLRYRSVLQLILLSLLTIMPAVTAQADATSTTVFLVRHAEKTEAADDPALSQAGEQRAAQLAGLLRDAGIESIYTTDFRRTRDTAAPLAELSGLTPQLYDWEALDALAAAMQQAGGRYLVVGHSDTTPELVTLLGGDAGEPIDEKGEYDRLYIVTVAPGGGVETVLLRYGEVSER